MATTVLSVNPKFLACTPRSCGNGVNIKYPFWIPYELDSFCGYPHCEITCKDKNPILKASNYDLLVKDINYSSSSFTAANTAVYEQKCPAPMHNYSFDQLPFTYSSENYNLSFFYNCTKKPIDYPTYEVDCAENATHNSFAVFHKEALEHINYSMNECQFMVNVPLNMNAVTNFSSLLRMNYTEILMMGFILNWTALDCQYCEKSGGRCGFDGDQFLCFCKDKSYLKSCGHGNHREWLVVVIVAASVVGVLVLAMVAFLFYRRKKKTSYGMPSHPSSLKDTDKTSQYNGPQLHGSPPTAWHYASSDAAGLLATCFTCKSLRIKGNRDIETFLENHGVLTLKRYKFSDVKKMTNSFKVKLGQGGFGTVYKGKLPNVLL
ncbi:hypothetical protein PIB30_078533 [Stylosanthes scabra]|uniref:non-specific serine/threonine protein kinase n=1 Tax=Stylosanthes scabra TaxID=79078 RepID=A0ABU6ZPK9_9FABA|nr:hypothetical protein [Stylosanthes scabra]